MQVFRTIVDTLMDLSHVSAPLSWGMMLYFSHVYNETVYLCTDSIMSLKFKALRVLKLHTVALMR